MPLDDFAIGAGDLREKVQIEEGTSSTTKGARTYTYGTPVTRRARVRPVRASERDTNMVEQYTETLRFTFRRDAVTVAIDERYRLTWDGQYYDVKQRGLAADKQFIAVIAQLSSPNLRDAQ